ncbi:MAG: hypothetical protein ACXW27_12365 [Allosphingosinicella sp.]
MNAVVGKLDNAGLKSVVDAIVVRQGNRYIKELLRDHKVPIGVKKEDFTANLHAAIDAGIITQDIIDAWLLEVEGWGNQHVYLLEPPAIGRADVERLIGGSPHSGLLDKPVSYEFPPDLTLTAIALSDQRVSLAWHRSNSSLVRYPAKDFERVEEDGERYFYKAYRERADRSVVRFEWQFADPYSALMMQLPNEGTLHADTRDRVLGDLAAIGLLTGLPASIPLSRSVKASSQAKDIVARSTKMAAHGGSVDLVATLDEGIAGVQALREVRRSMNESLFLSADGIFGFNQKAHSALSRTVKIEVFGKESRIRFWVQCKREDVYHVIGILWANDRAN